MSDLSTQTPATPQTSSGGFNLGQWAQDHPVQAQAATNAISIPGFLLEYFGTKSQWKYQTALNKSQAMVASAGLRTQGQQQYLQGQQYMTQAATNSATIQSAMGRDAASIIAQTARLGSYGGSSFDVMRDALQQATREQEQIVLDARRQKQALEASARMNFIQASYNEKMAPLLAGPKPGFWNMFAKFSVNSAEALAKAALAAG